MKRKNWCCIAIAKRTQKVGRERCENSVDRKKEKFI